MANYDFYCEDLNEIVEGMMYQILFIQLSVL